MYNSDNTYIRTYKYYSYTEYSKMFNEILFSLYCNTLFKEILLRNFHCHLEEKKIFVNHSKQ